MKHPEQPLQESTEGSDPRHPGTASWHFLHSDLLCLWRLVHTLQTLLLPGKAWGRLWAGKLGGTFHGTQSDGGGSPFSIC